MPRTATPSAQPHALDAEQTLLGALLLDGERFVDVSPLLSAPDFYDPLHQAIYAAVEKLYEARSPVDAVTVADALRNDEALTTRGGLPFLISLVANVPTSSHATRYAEIVRDAALRRKLRAIGETIAAVAVDDTFTATEALERSEQHLVGLAKRGSQNLPQHIADIGSESYERYTQLYEATDKSQLFGIRTGFTDLDHLLTGLQPGSLTIIAARPGMGKTSLALDVARNVAAKAAKERRPVLAGNEQAGNHGSHHRGRTRNRRLET
jgi:replicative DNA helicase